MSPGIHQGSPLETHCRFARVSLRDERGLLNTTVALLKLQTFHKSHCASNGIAEVMNSKLSFASATAFWIWLLDKSSTSTSGYRYETANGFRNCAGYSNFFAITESMLTISPSSSTRLCVFWNLTP